MRKILFYVVFFLLLCIKICFASGGLLDDTVIMSYNAPNLWDFADSVNRTVETGINDQWVSPNADYTVNPEDKSLLIDFTRTIERIPMSFNGIMLSGFNSILTNVTVDTNNQDWDNSRLYFGEHFVAFNLAKMTTQNGQHLYANFDFKPVSTPEPASMLLFGLGGLAMAVLKKRKKTP
jgi:hypothetical protein